ncbi:MAG TPA: SRPBCC domain-containing protein [Pyrinomonadaceae bacterium]|nr:SRPBCC domain-containing protein [Pyrinomonadaceae bacterium]
MIDIHTEIEIGAPPEVVWRVLTDFKAFPDWNPFVTSVSGEPEEGARLRITVKVPDGPVVKFKPTVLRAERARELRWIGRLAVPGFFSGEHFMKLEPAEGGRATRFVHGEHIEGLLLPFMGGTLRKSRRGYDLMNEALKARAEALAKEGAKV